MQNEMVPTTLDDLIRNLRPRSPVPFMEDTRRAIQMNDPEKYRQYAAECRRLSVKAAAKDKSILLELADAWIACAEEAARRTKDKKS